MKKSISILLALLLSGLVIWIIIYVYLYFPIWTYAYDGIGDFEDRGYRASSHRYLLKIDKINLSKNQEKTYTYKVGKLPNTSMRIGLTFPLDKENNWAQFEGINVNIEIKNESDDDIVLAYVGELSFPNSLFVPSLIELEGARKYLFYSNNSIYKEIKILGTPMRYYQRRNIVITFQMSNLGKNKIDMSSIDLILIGGGWK